jgi:putative transposase
MARPLRIEREGGWYHVTARGNERRRIYRDDRDRHHFKDLMAEARTRFRLRLHVYVLMDNHYHLLVELQEANLSQAMQWLNGSYSVWFNRRHRRSGHLFQGRFKSIVVSREEWGLALSRYLHLNPVRIAALGLSKEERRQSRQGIKGPPNPAQLRQRLAVLRQYRWSSYRAYIGVEKAPEWLTTEDILELGGGPQSQRRQRYRQSVEAEIREGMQETPWEQVQEQVVLGSRQFLKQVVYDSKQNEPDQVRLSRVARERPDWAAVIASVEKVKDEKWSVIRDRHGDSGRDMVLHLGRHECGLTLRELAGLTGLKSDAAVAMSFRRHARRLQDNPEECKLLHRAIQLLNVRS